MTCRFVFPVVFAVSALSFGATQASPRGHVVECFPPNKLHLNPSPLERSNVSKQKFNEIIDKAEALYAPIIASHKGVLKINRLWKDNTVNASARQDGQTWEVNMYGGLARRPEITPDGFAMVVCHELGHHLGGYSFYNDSEMVWAANEGQSDYFASHSCAREMWKSEPEMNAKFRTKVLPFAQKVCDTNFVNQSERDICYRSSVAGMSLATLLAKLRQSPAPKFETPDQTVVDVTYDEHPEAQCRLDTYLAGAACDVPFNKSIIPAKKLADKFGPEAERDAGRNSCLARDGWLTAQRPLCWFKPHFQFEGLVAGQPQWTDDSGNRRAEPGERLSLQLPLSNKLSRASESVSGELYSRTKGVTVENQKISYSDISGGSTARPSEPFIVRIAEDFPCGQPFELTFRASAKTGAREFPIKWFSGAKISADAVLGKSGKDVLIPDAPSEGLSIPIKTSQTVSTDVLMLDLEIDGYYPEEVEFRLRLPSGEELKLETGGLFERGSKASVRIQLPQRMSVGGEWTLLMRDMQENDTLTLKSFVLRAPFAERVSCSP